MAYKNVQLSLWTVVHISKLIIQRYKSLTKSEKWLIKNPSIPNALAPLCLALGAKQRGD